MASKTKGEMDVVGPNSYKKHNDIAFCVIIIWEVLDGHWSTPARALGNPPMSRIMKHIYKVQRFIVK